MYDQYRDWQHHHHEAHRMADLMTSVITVILLAALYGISVWFPHDAVRVRDAQGNIPWDDADYMSCCVYVVLALLWGSKFLFGSYERNHRHFM